LAYDPSWRFPCRWFQVGKIDSVELTRETAAFKFQLRVGHRPAARRDALRTCQRLEQEAARLRNQAAKERQMAKKVSTPK
jgi:hypothetical protein